MRTRGALTAGILGTVLALTGCKEDLNAKVYVRDLLDLAAEDIGSSVPVKVDLAIHATGIEKHCGQEDGKQIMAALAAAFDSAELVGCKQVSGSMDDLMAVRVTTKMIVNDGDHVIEDSNPVYFHAVPQADSNLISLMAIFNPGSFEDLRQRIAGISPMLRVDLNDVSMSVSFSNDTRDATKALVWGGTFLDGQPFDSEDVITLESRDEVTIRLGDVKTAKLVSYGVAPIVKVPVGKREGDG